MLFRNRYLFLFSKLLIFITSTPMPPNIPPDRSHWLRLLHVIEQREEHILRVNSLIRQLGSHGFLTDQYLLGPPIRFGEVNPSNTVVYRSAIHTRQGYGIVVFLVVVL
jgi:hypothetical protein